MSSEKLHVAVAGLGRMGEFVTLLSLQSFTLLRPNLLLRDVLFRGERHEKLIHHPQSQVYDTHVILLLLLRVLSSLLSALLFKQSWMPPKRSLQPYEHI